MTEWDPTATTILEPNPGQIGGKAAKSLDGDADLKPLSVPGGIVFSLTINSNPKKPDHPELRDVRLREAMSMAIDREQLIDVELDGFGRAPRSFLSPLQEDEGWVPESIQVDPHDPDRANQIFDELGIAQGQGRHPDQRCGRPAALLVASVRDLPRGRATTRASRHSSPLGLTTRACRTCLV